MGGITKRKPYAVLFAGIIFLSLGITTYPLQAESNSDTIIVDDDGTADYETIEQALQAAQNGDIIFVRSGLYEEQNLIVDKTLTITGENAATTVVQGDRTTTLFFIQANKVSISNFTVTRGGGDLIGSNLEVSADDCIISDNIITDGEDVGIAVYDTSNTVIMNNEISHCPFAGIRSNANSYGNTIQNNQITECINGILVEDTTEELIQYNIISHCSKAIYLEECNNNIVKRNHLHNNEQGMFVTYADDNLITENNFVSNREHAKFTTWLSPMGLQISTWDKNYYDDTLGILPKWIPGILFIRTFNPIGIFIPWGSLDWHPAQIPYDIVQGSR